VHHRATPPVQVRVAGRCGVLSECSDGRAGAGLRCGGD